MHRGDVRKLQCTVCESLINTANVEPLRVVLSVDIRYRYKGASKYSFVRLTHVLTLTNIPEDGVPLVDSVKRFR